MNDKAKSFYLVFDSSFWKKINDSLVPFGNNEKPKDKQQFLENL